MAFLATGTYKPGIPKKEMHQPESWCSIEILWPDFNNAYNNVMAHGVYNDDRDNLFPWL
ncbi:hypothetical protein [Niastella yeongjuensis]|nr:hypothetical protein [Niastella yeongjuensis]SEP11454.1 hypothetical protein SAMN05660816_04440 [Niastella yeongjuensis]